MDELIERKTKKMESENQDLIRKLQDDESLIREKADLVNKLKADNEKADRAIR